MSTTTRRPAESVTDDFAGDVATDAWFAEVMTRLNMQPNEVLAVRVDPGSWLIAEAPYVYVNPSPFELPTGTLRVGRRSVLGEITTRSIVTNPKIKFVG